MFSNFLESLYEGIGDDDAADDDEDNTSTPKSSPDRHDSDKNAVRLSPEEEAQARGVKDDLTELGHTLTRQFRGVANFLAPLPDGSSSSSSSYSDHPRLNQFRSSDPELNQSRSSDLRLYQSRSSDRDESCVGSDTPESGIRVRSWDLEEKGVEHVYNDPKEEEEEEEEEETDDEEEEIAAVALTDEVLAFARNIAMHPETWLDFPLDPDEDLDGNVYIESISDLINIFVWFCTKSNFVISFDLTCMHMKGLFFSICIFFCVDLEMTDAQRGHASAIERLAPRLAALRIELCPCHMSVGYFWKVYFVLLLSRLNKHDAHLLFSPQV